MKYILDSKMAQKLDQEIINKFKVPSVVLMERAAMGVAKKTAEIAFHFKRKVRIAAICGVGNNGADGIAVARILSWQGLPVDIIIIGDESKQTVEFMLQKQMVINSDIKFVKMQAIKEYDIIIDGLFGIGLSRDVQGIYQEAIDLVNNSKGIVVSIDIPSGIDGTKGDIRNVAVKADATVTFGYLKQGLVLYPGKELAGEITVEDIGYCPKVLECINPALYFTMEDIYKIPNREMRSNKGTYGRGLVIAGSEDMSGAAYLSGAAAYRSGVGVVEILTHELNSEIIKKLLVEAIVTGYNAKNILEKIEKSMSKADYIILGPGLSTNGLAQEIVKYVMTNGNVPVIIDADALNILSYNKELLSHYANTVIVTPHIGEMSVLVSQEKRDIIKNPIECAKKFAQEYQVICVLKDATTVVVEPEGRIYINTSGTPALAKGGSGDVLTGIICGMLALKIQPFSAAAMGTYIHGIAGEMATRDKSEHSLLATDIIEEIPKVLNKEK